MTSSKSGAARTRDELAAEMTRAFREYQRSVDALDELASRLIGVNRTDARVLDLLEQHGRLSAGDIAAGAALSSGAVTGVVDRLERAGYARRVADEEDRRRVLVEPTEKMIEAARDIYHGLGPKGEAAMKRYSADDLRVIVRFLDDVTELTNRHAAELRERGR
jgi:DNA-binding MarR family transcriptional regulator